MLITDKISKEGSKMKKRLSIMLSIAALSVICLFAFSANAQTKAIDSTNTTASTYFAEYTYAGKEITPALSVMCDDTKLVKDVDYTVSYINNVSVGTAKATITGIGDYSGTVEKTYPIVPVTDGNALKYSVASASYDGTAKTPAVTVSFRNVALTEGTDYTLSYSSNVNIGTGKVTVVGKGNFNFTKQVTFKIVPNNVTGLKFSPETNSIKLSWNKMNNVSGYQIFVFDSSKNAYKTVAFVSANTTSYTVKGLSPSTLYKYCVRAYREIGNQTYYGLQDTQIQTRTRSTSTTMKSAYINTNGLVASWNTVRGAGYVLRYATRSDFSNAKEVFINDSRTSSYTITNVNKSATYYVQVAPFTTLGTTKYYSSRSYAVCTAYGKRLAYYECEMPYNPDRSWNIQLAASKINGYVLAPGQTFSFNGVVGPRTYAAGYKDSPVIVGDETVPGVGGGICQLATTIFNAALYGNMDIVSRSQHSLRVTYVPYGRDATVSYGSTDFRFRNSTNYPIVIYTRTEGNKCICELYTCGANPIPKVTLDVTQHSNTAFTLRRYVNGSCNYSCYTKFPR